MKILVRSFGSMAILGLMVCGVGCVEATDSDDESLDDDSSALRGGGHGGGGSTTPGDADAFDTDLIAAINAARKANGVPPVQFDQCLDGYADKWGTYMAQTDLLVHQDLSKIASGCRTSWVGEVITRGVGMTAQGAVDSWMTSDGHRAAILSPIADKIGGGAGTRADGRRYFVADLAR
jgi:uncharacterized protein YkwD